MDPRKLSAVLGKCRTNNDTIAILVTAPGAIMELAEAITISNELDYQSYTNDGNPTNRAPGSVDL